MALQNLLWATGRRWPFRTSTQFSKAKLFLKEHEAFELVAQLEATFWVLRTSGAINCHGQLVRDSVPLPKMISDALRGRQVLRETANKFGARK